MVLINPHACAKKKEKLILHSEEICLEDLIEEDLIEGCKLLMCSRNRWRFSRPCAQLLNVSSTYLNQNPSFNVEVAKALFSNSSMNKLAITGDNGLPIGAPCVCS